MELWQIAIMAAAVVVVAGVGLALLFRQRQRTQDLSATFGPEYQHVVETADDRRAAEHELESRRERVSRMQLRALTGDEQTAFERRWRTVQAQFVDDPSGAVAAADTLVRDLMRDRGYEAEVDFEQRVADLSVHHGQALDDYRAARDIAERHAAAGVDTEMLRQALIHYHVLYSDLLESEAPVDLPESAADRAEREPAEVRR